jgi:hypothetical protein
MGWVYLMFGKISEKYHSRFFEQFERSNHNVSLQQLLTGWTVEG